MATVFSAVLEDYEEELDAIRILVQASADPALGKPRARIAGANAAVLLLAATFEGVHSPTSPRIRKKRSGRLRII